MSREILFRAKHIHTMPDNEYLNGTWVEGYLSDEERIYDAEIEGEFLIDKNTICQYTGLHDKNGKKIWENDVLMCYGNPKRLVQVEFGEFEIFDEAIKTPIESVVGWNYKVIPTDRMIACERFGCPMPLSGWYILAVKMEVIGNIFDNPELLQEVE